MNQPRIALTETMSLPITALTTKHVITVIDGNNDKWQGALLGIGEIAEVDRFMVAARRALRTAKFHDDPFNSKPATLTSEEVLGVWYVTVGGTDISVKASQVMWTRW